MCTVVLEEGSAEGVDVGVWVFDFSYCSEDAGDGGEAFTSEVADVVVFDVSVGEALEVHEAGVGVAEDCVSVAGDDSSASECFADELFDDGFAGFFSLVVVLELGQPLEALLVGQAVQGTGQTVHGGGEGEVGVGEGGADQHAGVGGDIAPFVVGVDREVASDALFHLQFIVAEHVAEVASPIE